MIQSAVDTIASPAPARPGGSKSVGERAPFVLPGEGETTEVAFSDERQDQAAPGTDLPPVADPALLALLLPPPPTPPATQSAAAAGSPDPVPAQIELPITLATPAAVIPAAPPLTMPPADLSTALPSQPARQAPAPINSPIVDQTIAVPPPPAAPIDPAPAPLPSHWQVAPGVKVASAAPTAPARPDLAAAPAVVPTLPDLLGEHPLSDQPTPPAAGILATSPLAITAAASSGQPTLDLGRERWPQDMIAHIEQVRDAADAADTRIRLVPDALGLVDIDVRREGDTLHVRFSAEQAQTRTLLAEAQPRLAEAAEARGLRLGQSSVDAGAAGHGQKHQPAARSDPRRFPAPRITDADTPADDTRIA